MPRRVLAALLAGIAAAAPLRAQADAVVRHVTVGGRERSYLVDLPPGRDARTPLPVVVVFHGGGGSGAQARAQTRMSDVGAREGFITVYPDGSARFGNLLTWNTGSCCGYARRAGVDEAAFVRALLDSLGALHPVDRRRVYATGLSNGGMMSYLVACQLADRFAAVAPVSGELSLPSCAPSRPVSVLVIHGTADQNLPYDGGHGAKALESHDVRPVSYAVDFWRAADRCAGAPVVTDDARLTHAVSAHCADDTAVELYTIKGGGHAWPGSQRTRRRADEPSTALDASAVVWAFFKAHSRQG